MTKREKTEISSLINSLTVWQASIRDLLDKNEKKAIENFSAEFDKRVSWYNEAADELIAMGIDVVKFR